jgi:hypothetical protein
MAARVSVPNPEKRAPVSRIGRASPRVCGEASFLKEGVNSLQKLQGTSFIKKRSLHFDHGVSASVDGYGSKN